MPDKSTSTVGARSFAGRGAPSASPVRPEPTEATQEGAANETYTKAEVLELLKQSKSENYQQTQSLLDQLDHRQAVRLKATMEPVNRTLAALEAAGVKVDAATVDKIRSQARVDALTGPDGAEDDVEDEPGPVALDAADGVRLDDHVPLRDEDVRGTRHGGLDAGEGRKGFCRVAFRIRPSRSAR